jgi:hypothetical protein
VPCPRRSFPPRLSYSAGFPSRARSSAVWLPPVTALAARSPRAGQVRGCQPGISWERCYRLLRHTSSVLPEPGKQRCASAGERAKRCRTTTFLSRWQRVFVCRRCPQAVVGHLAKDRSCPACVPARPRMPPDKWGSGVCPLRNRRLLRLVMLCDGELGPTGKPAPRATR